MSWEAVIGLEVHVQLQTRSKIFSGSSTAFGASPNSQASGLDLAMPGTLPVVNAEAIAMAIRFGLSVNAQIAPRSVFARKNYFYPDLPKGYQISQYELPVVVGGTLNARLPNGEIKQVQLTRAHLEEDAGKSVHEAFHDASGIDLNRAGVPLLEVVSEPCMHSPSEAVAYLRALHALVKALKICDGNMQEGSFRCDANVSVRRVGAPLGTRAEVKNVNSFRFVEKAIAYEIERQTRILEAGGAVVQETRLYDSAKNETRSMRSKESADDYRYFPDPDLPPLLISPAQIAAERARMPELPEQRRERYVSALGLSAYEADALALDSDASKYFEALLTRLPGHGKLAATWLMGELSAARNLAELEWPQLPIQPERMAELLSREVDGTLSKRLAKQVFEAMWQGIESADAVIARLGLKQISDASALGVTLDQVLAQFPAQVNEFYNGNDKVLQFLIGQAMKATRGQANPSELSAILRARLNPPK